MYLIIVYSSGDRSLSHPPLPGNLSEPPLRHSRAR